MCLQITDVIYLHPHGLTSAGVSDIGQLGKRASTSACEYIVKMRESLLQTLNFEYSAVVMSHCSWNILLFH